MRRCLLICAVLTAVVASAEKQPFERYQSIVDRQMFGPLPPGFDPTKNPSEVQKSSVSEKELTQEQAKLQSAIRFSVINVTPDGETAVGFSDNSDPKSPVRYYLKVGEKKDGWEVKEADATEARMTISKGEVEVTLTLGGDSSKTEGATTKADGVAPATMRRSSRGGRSGLLGGGSLAERRQLRRQREAEEQAQADAAAAAKEAERQAQVEAEKQQREAERAEQRQQLLAIQEELKRVREAKVAAKAEGSSGNEGDENN